jgi:hypothetical protein
VGVRREEIGIRRSLGAAAVARGPVATTRDLGVVRQHSHWTDGSSVDCKSETLAWFLLGMIGPERGGLSVCTQVWPWERGTISGPRPS